MVKKDIVSGIYKIRNIVNGKIYVGSSKDMYRRWRTHKTALRGQCHNNPRLQNSWNKYGEDSFIFSVIEYAPDIESLLGMEQVYLDKLSVDDYNIERVVGKPRLGTVHTLEYKEMMSKINKGKNNPFYGKKHSLNTRKLMSDKKSGENSYWYKREISDSHRKNLSMAKSGENHPMWGNNHSDESKSKISETLKKTARRGENSPSTNLTNKDVLKIRKLYAAGGVSQAKLGKMFGISGSTIGFIIRRETWKHI